MAKLDRCEEKEAFWRMVLDEHRGSRLSIRQFCKREGLGEASFYFWRREIGNRDRQGDVAGTGSKMIPIKIVQPKEAEPKEPEPRTPESRKRESQDRASSDQAASVTADAPIEVVTPTGFLIRSGQCDAVSIDAIVRLAHALAGQDLAGQVTSC